MQLIILVLTPKAVERIGKIVGIVSSTLDHYDKVTGIDHGSDRHKLFKDDLNLVLKELKSKVRTPKIASIKRFHEFNANLFNSINRKKFNSWINILISQNFDSHLVLITNNNNNYVTCA